MYSFSRAIYRELSGAVAHDRNATASRAVLLRECESAVERLVLDRHYFAGRTSTTSEGSIGILPAHATASSMVGTSIT